MRCRTTCLRRHLGNASPFRGRTMETAVVAGYEEPLLRDCESTTNGLR
jgi:hypothetical protein